MRGNLLEPLTDSVFYIMSAFSKPRHGYAVMTVIEYTTEAALVVGPASLYTIIKKVTKEAYIEFSLSPDSGRNVYVLTDLGRKALQCDIARRKVMIDFAENGLKRGEQDEEN